MATADADGMFAEGSRFGTYIIGPCIGHGGMARVYRAEHQGLQRQVALKVLTDGVGPGTEGRARFVREARIAAAIKHPNVVNIFDIGVENRVPFLVMELLVGQDLEALLQSQGALSEPTLIDIIIPVVAGLVAVHDAGIVHRDLKPGNIFLSKGVRDEVEPKLLDFGISKAAGADKLRVTSVQGLLMGTPLYMSPEALMGEDMTALSDQYSLGVVMYECATGINPFVSDSVAETARRVTSGEFAPLSEHAIRPSRRLASIIERAMSLDPQQRFPDMRTLGQELLSLAGQRTRITWGFTFGELSRAQPALTVGAATAAHPLTPRRMRNSVGRWPLLTAAAFGLASLAALMKWSTYRGANVSTTSSVMSAGMASEAVAANVATPETATPEAVVRALTPRAAAAPVRPVPDPFMSEPTASNVSVPSVHPAAADVSAAAWPTPEEQAKPQPAGVCASLPSSETAALRPSTQEQPGASAPTARERPPARAVPPAAPSAARVPPRPGVQELSPEWMIWPSISPKSRYHRRSQTGTNDAPIFD
jgi:eukaryotic-like serine/threonine-protein kinase